MNDLEGIDPKVQAARIGSTVGTKKRVNIIEAADVKGIRILNRGVL
ncbi:MAG: eL32 family ribosomal protein [Candidatus Thermoplasmatota archaeon]|nr:eL32 family ribosomal protein [Candidatus Thermoplasmatota archaeon]